MKPSANSDKRGWAGTAMRQAALTWPLRELHREVLRWFLDTGVAPTRDWLLVSAEALGLGESAIDDLAKADLVHVADGVVTVAYPFSGTPTRQIVELDGCPAVYAMCAIDALGLPAMAARDGRVAAIDPRDGAVVVSVRGRRWTWTPAETVVLYGRAAQCGPQLGSCEVMCPHTTFHASRGSAQAHLASRDGVEGEILNQRAAIKLGQRTFAPLLGGRA